MSQKQEKPSGPSASPDKTVRKEPASAATTKRADNPLFFWRRGSRHATNRPAGRHRWSRRLLWIAAIVVAVCLVLRSILWASLPWFLNKATEGYGLHCTYERLSLSLLTGDAELWHLVLKPAETADPLAHLEYCRAEVSLTTLLARRLVVPRLEVDGMDVNLTRTADGTFLQLRDLLKVLAANKSGKVKADAQVEAKPAVDGQIDLTAPIKLDALRLQHVQVNFRDESVSPILESRLDMSVRLSDVGSEKRQTRFQVTLSSPPVLNQFVVEGTGHSLGMDLAADVKIELNGLHPQSLKDYLSSLGISPEAENLALTCRGQIRTRGIEGILAGGPGPSADPKSSPAAKGTQPVPPTLNVLADLNDVLLTADGLESFALGKVAIDANLPRADRLNISNVEVAHGRAHVWKRADGALSVAGLKVTGGTNQQRPPEKNTPTPVASSAPVEQTSPAAKDPPPFTLSMGDVSLSDLKFIFHDESVLPKTDLAFLLRALALQSDQPQQTLNSGQFAVLADMSIPGVAETIGLKGTVELTSARKSAALRLSSSGVRPDSLSPYLEAVGLKSLHEDGQFVCDVNASLASEGDGPATAGVSITGISLRDKKGELFGLDSVALQGFQIEPNPKVIRIASLDITGQRLALGRDQTGCFNVLGFQVANSREPQKGSPTGRTQPSQVGPASPGATRGSVGVSEAAETSEIKSTSPRIQIGRFSWRDNQITFNDQGISPAKSIVVPDIGLEVNDLVVDFSGDPAAPATLTAWLDAPGIVTRIAMSGSLSTKRSGMSLSLKLSGEGLTAAEAAPYLQSLGLESAISDGNLQAALDADLGWASGALDCSVSVRDVALANGAVQLAGLKRLQVDKLQLQANGLGVGSVELEQPYLTASRESSGALNLAGVRLLAKQKSEPRTASPPASASASEIRISRFNIADAQLHWSDQAVQPAVSQALRANVTLTDLGLGFDAPPSPLNVAFEAPGVLKRAELSGTIRLTPSEQGANLKIEASGIQTERLIPYFPAGPRPALKDASFRGQVEARVAKHPEGGYQASLALGNFDYRDGDGKLPLLGFDSAKATLNRFDPNAQVISVEELSIHGLAAGAQRNTTGVLTMLGFELGSGASQAAGSGLAPATSQTGRTNQTSAAPGAPTSEAGRLKQLPLVTLKTLDLNLREFGLTDHTRPTAKPVTIADLRIRNTQPIELLGENPDANPAVNIDITGKVQPFTESLTLKTGLSPFVAQPRVQVQWDLRQIKASELVAVLPELATALDAGGLKDGQLSGTAEVTLALQRRNVMDFDLGKPFGLNLLLKDIQLVDPGQKQVLAGFEELRVDILKMDLAGNSIRVKEIGLTKPQGTVSKESDGLHVLGLVLKTPAPAPASSDASRGGEKGNSADANSVKTADAANAKAARGQATRPSDANEAGSVVKGPDVQIDQILVNGIDFTFVDRTTDPAMHIPLTGMDVEVRSLATPAAGLSGPIRFNVILTAGEVPLSAVRRPVDNGSDKSPADSNDVEGAAPTSAKPESQELAPTEKRLLFQEMSANGRLALYPKLDGWVKAGVSGLELVNFRGTAGQAGVTLNDGILDASVDMRFRKDGALATRTQIVFTDLSLTEPPDGFLRKLLSLPTSLDTVLFILQDSGGAIRLPLAFEVKEGGLSGGQIAGIAVGAAATLIANAVANSPFRIAGTVGDIVGVGAEETGGSKETYSLEYVPGVTAASAEHGQTLDKVLARLRKDKDLTATIRHQLGAGDVNRVDALVNPLPPNTAELLAQLKAERNALEAGRGRLASETRAAYASGYYPEAWAKTQHLQQAERNLGLTERALDDLLEMTRPGAEHAAKRRTRDASLAIGRARLDAIASLLASRSIADIQGRIKFAPPSSTVAQDGRQGNVTITLSLSKAR